VHIGRQAIRGFYSNVENIKSQTEVMTLRALGSEAAFYWTLTVDLGNGGMRIEIISVMVFDDEGKIASMKAY
jgi:steroid delta-isomerase